MGIALKKKHRSTPKTVTEMAIVDHIVETYGPTKAPLVLMWRETMNNFNQKNWPRCPVWTRDDRACHEHWKKFGPGVVRELERRYKLTVVKVSGRIRDLVKHQAAPDRSGKRTDAAYRECLPNSAEMTRGIVCFPRETQQDHPLIIADRDRRLRSSATGFGNASSAVDTANDLGVLSDDARREMRGHVIPTVERAISENKYPLFPRETLSLEPPGPSRTARPKKGKS
jgi:hypothetical protein